MKLLDFIKNKSGSVATITAVMALPLLFVTGVSVDYAIMNNLDSAMQNSADASVLASAKELSKIDDFPAEKAKLVKILVDNWNANGSVKTLVSGASTMSSAIATGA